VKKLILERYLELRKRWDFICLEELKLKSELEIVSDSGKKLLLRDLYYDKDETRDLLKINCMMLGIEWNENEQISH
jgi:hypothetical protein